MCVLTKWNLRKWFARRRKTMRVFNERLFDLGIGNWNALSRRRLALFSHRVNTVCSPPFFSSPLLASPAPFCLLYSPSNSCRRGEGNKKWDLNNTGEGKWRRNDINLFHSVSPLSRWTRERRTNLNKGKNRLPLLLLHLFSASWQLGSHWESIPNLPRLSRGLFSAPLLSASSFLMNTVNCYDIERSESQPGDL